MNQVDIKQLYEKVEAREREMIADGLLFSAHDLLGGGTVQLLGLCLRYEDLQPCVIYEHDGVHFICTLAEWDSPLLVDGREEPKYRKLTSLT